MEACLDAVSDLRRPGRLYKLAGDRFAIDAVADSDVDEKTMSASAIISTPTPDRVNDVMVPKGIILDDYRTNPVVLLEHGFYHSLPIGKSEDPEGNLTVEVGDDVRATCYFSQKDLVAAQAFNLVAEKILRATSVRFSVRKSRVQDEDGEQFFFVDEWPLEEWSWCAIGCNPEALAQVVSKNRLCGKKINEGLLKSLQIWVPEQAAQSTGWTPDKERAMAKTNAAKPAKTNTKADKPEDDEPKPGDEKPKSDGDKPADETPADEEGEGEQQKFGAQLLTGVHGALSDLATNLTAGRAMLENPKVSEALDAAQPLLDQALSIVAGCYADAYGKELAPTDEPKPEDTAKSFNDFLATGIGPQVELCGIGAALRTLAKASNIDARQKKSCAVALKTLERLIEQSKVKRVPTKTTEADPKQAKAVSGAIEEMRGEMTSLKKLIDDIRPFQKPAA